ncbi:MAG: DUF2461 domain-containing protein [Myxococcota bacterium]
MFQGFSKQSIAFLRDLEAHNNREWFEANKDRYKQHIEAPSKQFLQEILQQLPRIAGKPLCGKIFRIYRDVRFSKDKTPYNAYVRMLFRCAHTEKIDCGSAPAFYFSLQPEKVLLGVGVFEFSKTALNVYRQAVTSDVNGKKIDKILAACASKKGFYTNEPQLKRVPSGYDKDHPRAQLLRRKGLTIWHESKPNTVLATRSVDNCLALYKEMQPVYQWMQILQG